MCLVELFFYFSLTVHIIIATKINFIIKNPKVKPFKRKLTK